MGEYSSVGNRGGGSSSSWWKYLLALIVGLAVGVGGYFGIAELIGDNSSQPTTASTPEKAASTRSTPEKAKPATPKKPAISLEKEFCSKPSGICFNYPQGFNVTEDVIPSETANTWEWYAAKLADREGNQLIQLIDIDHGEGQYKCEDSEFSDTQPIEVVDSAPTKWKIEGEDGQQITVHAVKLVVALQNNEGPGFVYAPIMRVTAVDEMFNPGKLPDSCRLESGNSINLAENSVSIEFSSSDKDRIAAYKTPAEARHQLKTKRMQLAWGILQTAHTK